MDTTKEFQILIKRKIPFLSEGLLSIVTVLLLIMCLLYFFMLPAKDASTEMATAYYLLVVPEWLKELSAFAFVGLLVFMPLYFVARIKTAALMTLGEDAILIKSKKLNLAIPFRNIKRIYFNDLKNLLRQPKEKLQIVIQQKSDKLTTFLLANYNEGELALDSLSKITGIEFAFYDNKLATMHDDE